MAVGKRSWPKQPQTVQSLSHLVQSASHAPCFLLKEQDSTLAAGSTLRNLPALADRPQPLRKQAPAAEAAGSAGPQPAEFSAAGGQAMRRLLQAKKQSRTIENLPRREEKSEPCLLYITKAQYSVVPFPIQYQCPM